MNIRLLPCLVAFLALCSPLAALASGSAPARRMPPKKATPATAAPAASDARYALGQQVFSGTAPAASQPGSLNSQKTRLEKAAAAVPDAKKGKSLVAMAGKLSASQLDALEYFVTVRFPK